MFRLLLLLSALALVTGFQTPGDKDDEPTVMDLSECPIHYYGTSYKALHVNTTSGLAIGFGPFSVWIGGSILKRTNPVKLVFKHDDLISAEQRYRQHLQNLTGKMLCEASLNSGAVTVKFACFGEQTALLVETISEEEEEETECMMFKLQVCDELVDKFLIASTADSGITQNYLNINKYNFSNGWCVGYDSMCTVTGPTVITFDGKQNFVNDRCTYTLLGTDHLCVKANFSDRARTDVSFLDSLRITFKDTYDLLQDGRVELNGVPQIITSSPVLIGAAMFSKNRTGITAQWIIDANNYTVFFDGNTAQITYSGSAEGRGRLKGMCVDQHVDESRQIVNGCQRKFPDPTKVEANSMAWMARCKLMRSALFYKCHHAVDPEPYIKACLETLSKYPLVEGFDCQFIETYNRICSHRGVTLPNWRPVLKCGLTPEAFCKDNCSSHEYCGKRDFGRIGCFCRAIFASKYRTSNTYGDPAACIADTASVTLVGCLLEEKGFSYQNLHLNDKTCVGQVDEKNHTVTFSFDTEKTCGANITTLRSKRFFKNIIMTAENPNAIIIRHNEVSIDFSCYLDLPGIMMTTLKIQESSVVQTIISGKWEYTLAFKAYTNADFIQSVSANTELQLGQKIWLKLSTEGLDGSSITPVTDHCWAANQASPWGAMTYDLIKDGCAADMSVQLEWNGEKKCNFFSFDLFHFTRSSGKIYLNCKVKLCAAGLENCVPDCNMPARRRRSVRVRDVEADAGLISIVLTQ